MNRRIPIVAHKCKICIICEGSEEYEYLDKLKELNLWNYEVVLKNAEGNGNIVARYQDAYQSDNYEVVFAFVDTDRKPYEQYEDIKRKINDIYGNENAAKHVVIFGNPCTMQIILLHFDDIKIKSHKKFDNASFIYKYTGIEKYNAKREKRQKLFSCIDMGNYHSLVRRLKNISHDDTEKNSTNFIYLLNCLTATSNKWIDDINDLGN